MPDLKLKDYFKRIYDKTDKNLYYPSRKNTGVFITKLFMAGGSNHFTLLHGKNKSENVETQRKIYNGSFEFTPDLKLTFRRVDIDGLTAFFKGAVPNGRIRELMRDFGVPGDTAVDAELFCKALAYQFEAFVHSTTQEAEDIVLTKYQLLLKYGDDQTEGSMATRYPGDKMKVSSGREKQYRVNCYEAFQHTWIIDNAGTVEWRDRRLQLKNNDEIKLKVDSVCLEIPTLRPGEQIKIATGIEARGKEDTTEFQWVMIDKDGKNCFPEDRSLYIKVTVRFEPMTGK